MARLILNEVCLCHRRLRKADDNFPLFRRIKKRLRSVGNEAAFYLKTAGPNYKPMPPIKGAEQLLDLADVEAEMSTLPRTHTAIWDRYGGKNRSTLLVNLMRDIKAEVVSHLSFLREELSLLLV